VIEGLKRNFERAMQAQPALDSGGKPTGEYRYNGSVATRCLELLGKELGMFVDRTMEVRDPSEWSSSDWQRAIEQFAAKIGVAVEVLEAEAAKQEADGDAGDKVN
jgi:hypothetical protein